MSVNFLSASSYSVPKVENGVAGAVFFSALIKSVTAWLAALVRGIHGIMVFSGNKSTLSEICSALVSEIHTL